MFVLAWMLAASASSAAASPSSVVQQQQQAEQHHHNNGHDIYCRHCGHKIGSTADHLHVDHSLAQSTLSLGTTPEVSLLTQSGPHDGPHPVLHKFNVGTSSPSLDVATFSKLDGYNLDGKYEATSAFFPDYGWTAVMCPHCKVQIGWLFEEKRARSKRALERRMRKKKKKKKRHSTTATTDADGKRRSKSKSKSNSRGKSTTGRSKSSSSSPSSSSSSSSTRQQQTLSAASSSSSSSSSSRQAADAPAALVARTEEEKLESMEKRCLFFPQGYWTIRFCHKYDVVQYHQTPKGEKVRACTE